jgi:hypothetical protein
MAAFDGRRDTLFEMLETGVVQLCQCLVTLGHELTDGRNTIHVACRHPRTTKHIEGNLHLYALDIPINELPIKTSHTVKAGT